MEISNREIMRCMKMGKTIPDERTSLLVEEILSVLKENITPKNVYKIYDCKVDSAAVTFGGMTISSGSLAGHLENCRRAVLLAATLGTGTDMLIRRYSVQDMEKTLIAQAACTAMIEAYCDETEKEFSQAQELKELYPVTRYSPGYGDFDITFQKDILKLLDASRIGLSLTDGFMLTPSKSVTAVIGFSEKQKQAAGKCAASTGCDAPAGCDARCAACTDKNCVFREEVK